MFRTVVVPLVAILSFTLLSAAQGPFRAFENSESPDGKFAVGWRVAEKKVDWPKLESGDQAYFDSLGDWSNSMIKNAIIEAATLKRATLLPKVHHWAFADRSLNHSTLTVAWSPDSSQVVVAWSSKWRSEGVHFCRRKEAAFEGPCDLAPALRTALMDYCNEKHREKFEPVKDSLEIDFSEPRVSDDKQLKIRAIAQVPKSEDAFGISAELEVTLPESFPVAGREPVLEVTGIREEPQ